MLSLTAPIVPSRTRSSCYREPKSGLPPSAKRKFRDSNFTNQESNLLRERLVRASTTIPVIDLCLQSGSNNYFCKSDFTEDALHHAPQHRGMHGCGDAT